MIWHKENMNLGIKKVDLGLTFLRRLGFFEK